MLRSQWFVKLFLCTVTSLIIFSCSSNEQKANGTGTSEQNPTQDQTMSGSQSIGQKSLSPEALQTAVDLLQAMYGEPPAGRLIIQSYGPTGEVRGQVQIRINFAKPIVPLTALSDGIRDNIADYFKLEPHINGKFRVLGTQSVVFEPEHSLPMATGYIVTVKKGLRDIERNELPEAFTWSFSTPLPQIQFYPHSTQNEDHFDIEKEVTLVSNIALNVDVLKGKIEFSEVTTAEPVRFEILQHERNPKDGEDIGIHRIRYMYLLDPAHPLKKDTRYRVCVQSGLTTKYGNLPTENQVCTTFKTYPPFEFLKSGFCGCGGKLTTAPYLEFTNRPDMDSFNKLVGFDPDSGKPHFNPYPDCGEDGIGINDFDLEPHTTYTLTLHGGMLDVYGQSLENPETVTFTTGDLRPQMWGPDGFQIITPHLEPTLAVKTVNINTITSRITGLKPKDILVREHLDYYHNIHALFDNIRSPREKVKIELNDAGVGKSCFDLSRYLKNHQYGVVAYQFESPNVPCYQDPIRFNGLILRTNIGIYTQLHPNGGVVKLNRLTDGLPMPNARVKIYREEDLPALNQIWNLITDTYTRKIDPCIEGMSDDHGVMLLSQKEIVKCTKRRIRNNVLNELMLPEADPDDEMYDQERFGFANPPALLFVVEADNDWTFLQTDEYGNPSIWSFGLEPDWEAERPISRGTIFSDQDLYRPGDTVKMKGVSRYLLYGKMYDGRGLDLSIQIRDPFGATEKLTNVTVSDFGTFHFDVPTREDQPLGYYTVVAEAPNKSLNFYGSFRLAEFRVPEFSVSMNVKSPYAFPGTNVALNWHGKYYFGAPMAGASSSLNITRRPADFRPKGWDEFTFGIPDHIENRQMSLSGRHLRETLPLNGEGIAGKQFKLKKEDIPYPMRYLCDVEITDVSNQTLAANKIITALPHDELVGLKLGNWIVAVGDTVKGSVLVTTPEGEMIPNVPVRLKLIKRIYHSVKTKTPDGRYRMEHTAEEETVETQTVRTGDQPVMATLIPKSSGSFYVLAELVRHPRSGTQAAASVWVAGEDYVPWKDEGEDKLEIILDQTTYEVGDDAVAFIRSPFPEAELFFNVCREEIFLSETRKIKGGGYRYKFKVTETMIPNAYVGAVLFRQGDAIVPVEEEKGKHMEKIGFAGFGVSLKNKTLDVNIQPNRETLRPAETLELNLSVQNDRNVGHRSELAVIVVDEAVLSLTGYRPPDLMKIVYRHRGLSARLSDNRPFVITREELLQKGMGYGGGMMDAGPGPQIRKNFLKLAFYDPALVTDQNGKARVSVKLPDNLTTWRIMVVAVGEKDHFGYAEKKVVATQPFVLRPLMPRFSRLGDQFCSGVAITNLTEGPGMVDVRVNLTGDAVAPDSHPSVQKGIRIEKGASRAVLFPFTASRPGESQFTVTAKFNGRFGGETLSESDALEFPISVHALLATETVTAVGETEETAKQQIMVDKNVREDVGGLKIILSSTALTHISEGAKYLVDYPYGCLEQTTSRLITLIQLKFLSEKYGFSLEAAKPIEKVIDANFRKIYLMQHSDGGFKFWPTSDESSCYLSPYVAYLFNRCETLGYDIPQEKIRNLTEYLHKVLRSPCYPISTWKGVAEYRIQVLLGLYYLGQHDETYFEEYFNKRNELSFGAQIQLALLMNHSLNWKNEARTLLQEIKNGLFITAQTAHFESPRALPPSWAFLDSPIITTADAVRLFLRMEPESELIGKMARYILNARKNGRWRNTYENAKAIDGLVEISLIREKTPPDYTAKVLVAGQELVAQVFQGHQHKPVEGSVPISRLPGGLKDVSILKQGEGVLYYVLSYAYCLKGLQPARREGFSIKRSVGPAESENPLVQYDMKPPAPVKFNAGDVVTVTLEFKVNQTGYHVVIDDPIPSGLEVIDASLKTTSTRHQTSRQQRQTRGYDDAIRYGGNPINHTELRDDRVVLFADAVRPGIYTYQYLLRATISGTFLWPGAKISLMYEPEQFGTCAEGVVIVQ